MTNFLIEMRTRGHQYKLLSVACDVDFPQRVPIFPLFLWEIRQMCQVDLTDGSAANALFLKLIIFVLPFYFHSYLRNNSNTNIGVMMIKGRRVFLNDSMPFKITFLSRYNNKMFYLRAYSGFSWSLVNLLRCVKKSNLRNIKWNKTHRDDKSRRM